MKTYYKPSLKRDLINERSALRMRIYLRFWWKKSEARAHRELAAINRLLECRP